MFYERTKYDVRYYFVLDVIVHGDIIVNKVSPHDNLANMMTKLLFIAMFENWLDLISVYC